MMMTFKNIKLKFLLLLFIWTGVLALNNNQQKLENNNKTRKTCTTGCYNRMKFGAFGRYNAKIHGLSGNYQPDKSGEYSHIKVPYDGGYGDRGELDIDINDKNGDAGHKFFPTNDQHLNNENNQNFDHGVGSRVNQDNNQNSYKSNLKNELTSEDNSEKIPGHIAEIQMNELSSKNNSLDFNDSNADLNENKTNIPTPSENGKYGDISFPTEETIDQDESTEDDQEIEQATETQTDINSSEVIENGDSNLLTIKPKKQNSVRAPYAAKNFKPFESRSASSSYSNDDKKKLYASKFPYNAYDGLKLFRIEGNTDYNVSYHYIYETDNNIEAEETGYLENLGKKEAKMRVKGFYHYESDNGEKYKVNYEADQYGFYPQGSHLHKTLMQALQYLRKRLQEDDEI